MTRALSPPLPLPRTRATVPCRATCVCRRYVVFMIPTLNQLDFSPITRQDRETAKTWAQVFRKKLSGVTEEEEF